MNEKNNVSHDSHVLRSKRNGYHGGQLQGLARETLKKFDVNLEKIKNEVNIISFEMVDYEEKTKYSVFGEKESISYKLCFITYNIEFQAKLLTFEYKSKSEVLKLDVDCTTPNVRKEIKYCCNCLKRKRNLNLMFITLILFARYLESRRLICDLILKKTCYIRIIENRDGGKIIIYTDEKMNIKLGVFWSVECNSDYEIIDKVEIYYKVSELPNKVDIKHKLTQLTEPHLEFNEKYHLWKDLLEFLCYNSTSVIVTDNEAKVNSQIINSLGENFENENISVIKHPHSMFKVKKEEPDQNDNDDASVISLTAKRSSDYQQNPLVCIKNSKLISKNSKEASILLSDNDDVDVPKINKGKQTKQNRNDKPNHFIYIDSLDDKIEVNKPACLSSFSTVTSASSFKEIEQLNNSSLLKHDGCSDISDLITVGKCPLPSNCNKRVFGSNELPSMLPPDRPSKTTIEVTDADLDSIISLCSDNEDNLESEVFTLGSNSPKISIGNDTSILGDVLINISPDSTAGTSKTVIEIDSVLPPKKQKIVDDDLEITCITYLVPD